MVENCSEFLQILLRESNGHGLHDRITQVIRVSRAFPLNDLHRVVGDGLSSIGFDDNHGISLPQSLHIFRQTRRRSDHASRYERYEEASGCLNSRNRLSMRLQTCPPRLSEPLPPESQPGKRPLEKLNSRGRSLDNSR